MRGTRSASASGRRGISVSTRLVLRPRLGEDPAESEPRVPVGGIDLEHLAIPRLGIGDVACSLLFERLLASSSASVGRSLSTNSFTIGSGIAPTNPSTG